MKTKVCRVQYGMLDVAAAQLTTASWANYRYFRQTDLTMHDHCRFTAKFAQRASSKLA